MSVKTSTVVTLGVLGFLVIVAITVALYCMSLYNGGMEGENQIHGAHEKEVSVLSSYSSKVSDMVQIPKMAKKQLQEMVTAQIQARYGEKGSQAVFQWLQEQNVAVDQNLYTQIQRVMESGRNDFESAQTVLISKKQAMYTKLNTLPDGFVLKLMGFPKKNYGYNGGPDDYAVIKSDYSKQVFETKIDNGLEINP